MPLKDPEARRAYQKKLYEMNKEVRKTYTREYGRQHRDERRVYDQEYRQQHLDRIKAYDRMRNKLPHRVAYRKTHQKIISKRYRERHPEQIKINHQRLNPRKILFRNRRICLKENPRKGVCSNCGKVGLTHMHHDIYDETNVLANTRELCISCHARVRNQSRDPITGRFIKIYHPSSDPKSSPNP